MLLGLVVALDACHGAEPSPPPATAPPAVPAARPAVAPRTAVHGAEVRLVAVTDAGDAALSADQLDGLRLWPKLDGTREPVIVRSLAPEQLALGRTRDGLVAGVLDEVGQLEVLAFDRAGALLGRSRLPLEPAIADVAAIDGGLLVARVDHAILRIAPSGQVTAQLAPAP